MTTPAPPILRTTHVHRSPEDAFRIFTDEIGAWWPLPSHGMFGDEAGALAFRDGQLVETATDGRTAVWGEVQTWNPPSQLSFTWHPGQAPDEASIVAVSFEAHEHGTRVVLEHRGWEAFGADAMARRRSYVGPSAWGSVLDEFADGAEPRPDGPDLTALAAAYGRFFAAASSGAFSEPTDGGWNAEQVVAHVALNDLAMIGVCQALVHDRPLHFENVRCQDPTVLSDWIVATGDLDALIDRGRQASRQVLAALSRLSAAQRETEVHCRLLHDGDVMVDAPRPWAAVAIETQAVMHLPAHTSQLEALRR